MNPTPLAGPNLILYGSLPWGPGTSVKKLMVRLGWEEREVRQHLDELTQLGYPVVTLPVNNGRSVYLARTPEELEAGIAHLRSKQKATEIRIARLEQIQGDWPWGLHQMQLAI